MSWEWAGVTARQAVIGQAGCPRSEQRLGARRLPLGLQLWNEVQMSEPLCASAPTSHRGNPARAGRLPLNRTAPCRSLAFTAFFTCWTKQSTSKFCYLGLAHSDKSL